jgi:ankyrin repeat protein
MSTRRAFFGLCCALILSLAGCGRSQPPPPSANEVQEFHSAVQEGDPAVVDRLLRAKPGLVNVPDSTGKTALKIANEQNNQELADVLKKYGGHE